MTNTIRDMLDYSYVVPALLRGENRREIANRESERLGIEVTKNVIIGVARDIRAGKLDVTGTTSTKATPKTFVYGTEPDNGGLPVYTGHLELNLPRVLVLNDLHIPYMNFDFATKAGHVAQHYDIQTVILAGDVFHGEQRSPWRRTRGASFKTTTMRHDLDMVGQYLDFLLDCGIKTIYAYPGNHDAWLTHEWAGDLAFSDIMSMLSSDNIRKRMVITPYDRVTVMNDSHKWVIPHQAAYSVYSLKVGDDLAQKYQANVITTHQHNSAIGMDNYGRYIIIDSGGLHNPTLTAYLGLKTTTRPNADNGFVTLVDGLGELWTPDDRITNWSRIYGDI
jgi:predicted phosphodiesterase